ncbi:MAG: ornithine cyclodeaminase family protein [Pyrobaculum sp.]
MLLLPNIDFLIDVREAVDAIKSAYLSDYKFLPRQALTVGDVWFAPMVGHSQEVGFVVKLVGIYPRATPTVKAVVAVIDRETGAPKALINGTQLTAWRTAAASALAASAIQPSPRAIGLIGAGLQGEYHLKIFKTLYPSAEFKIYDVFKERAAALAEKYGAAAAELEEIYQTDLIIAATTSRQPVVKGSKLKKDTAVISIGAPRPVRELDDDVIKRGGCVLVDNPHAPEETEDVGDKWVYFGDFLKGSTCQFGELKVYKSVGNPIFDVAMAQYVLKRAERLGVGVEIQWA